MNAAGQRGQNSSERVSVVGSGLAGLACATLLARQGHDVTLIEAIPVPGGLLRRREQPGMGSFDCGTHLIEETGIDALDQLLFTAMDQSDGWNCFTCLPNAAYFGGRLSRSGFIDTRSLDEAVCARGFKELLALPKHSSEGNLKADMEARFGQTFAQHVHAPVVQKLLGVTMDTLATQAVAPFGLSRLVCGTPDETDALKRTSAWHDERLAFHEPVAATHGRRYFYPQQGGVNRWVEKIVGELTAHGVSVLTGDPITRIEVHEERVTALTLTSGTRLATDLLAWTVPAVGLLKLAGSPLPAGLSRPGFTQTLLIDLIVDLPPLVDSLYVTCYEPDCDIFRVTLYDNLQRSVTRHPHRLTIEVVRPPGRQPNDPLTDPDTQALFDELRQMGLFPARTRILKAARDLLPVSYPLMTARFIDDQRHLGEQAAAVARNVRLLGQAAGAGFFKHDILDHVVRSCTDLTLQHAA